MAEILRFGDSISHGVALGSDSLGCSLKFSVDNAVGMGFSKRLEIAEGKPPSVSPRSGGKGDFLSRNNFSRFGLESSTQDIESNPASIWRGGFSEDNQSQEVLRSQRLVHQRRLMEDKVSHHLHHLEFLHISQPQQQQDAVDFLSEPSSSSFLTGPRPSAFPVHEESYESSSSHATQLPLFNRPMSLSNDSIGSQHQTSRMIYQVQFKRYVRFYTIGDHGDVPLSSLSSASSLLPLPISSPSSGSALLRVNMGDFVIVNADRGEDLGIVTMVFTMQEFIDRRLAMSAKCNIQEEDAVIGTILRLATLSERQQLPKKYKKEEAVVKAAKELAHGTYHLPLTIHDADYHFDGHKLTIFYSSDARVDFRDYVRDLFTLFKTRIWMKKDPRMLLRRDSHGTSFSLLGYVFDDNAAIALMTGMQIAMEPSHIAQRGPPPRQAPASAGHGNPMYPRAAGYPSTGHYIHHRHAPVLPPPHAPQSQQGRYVSYPTYAASPMSSHKHLNHSSSALVPPDARFLYSPDDKQQQHYTNAPLRSQQQSFLY